MENTQDQYCIAKKTLICTLFIIFHISTYSQSYERIITSDIKLKTPYTKDTTTQQKNLIINKEEDIKKLLDFSKRQITDYTKVIGKTILINYGYKDEGYSNIYAIRPDTVWLRRKTKRPKPTDYKLIHNYKAERNYQREYYYTPVEEIDNKQFKVIGVSWRGESIDLTLQNIIIGDTLIWKAPYTNNTTYGGNKCRLSQVTVVEEMQQIRDFLIGRKYYSNANQMYVCSGVKIERMLDIYGIYVILSSNETAYPLSIRFDKFLYEFKTEKQQEIYEAKELKRKRNAGSYHATLIKVEKPANRQIKYGKTSVITEKELLKYKYEDNIINILWHVSNDNFNFVLKNKSLFSLKIIWDDAAYIDEEGIADRLSHVGTKYSERNNSQPPSVVLKDATLVDLLVPVSKIYYRDGWGQHDLFPYQKSEYMENKTVRVSLPIQIQGTTNEYVFTFKVAWKYTYPELQIDKK